MKPMSGRGVAGMEEGSVEYIHIKLLKIRIRAPRLGIEVAALQVSYAVRASRYCCSGPA